jgi:hypothetical protein
MASTPIDPSVKEAGAVPVDPSKWSGDTDDLSGRLW